MVCAAFQGPFEPQARNARAVTDLGWASEHVPDFDIYKADDWRKRTATLRKLIYLVSKVRHRRDYHHHQHQHQHRHHHHHYRHHHHHHYHYLCPWGLFHGLASCVTSRPREGEGTLIWQAPF
jgi:hypothetical protein